MAAFCCVPLVDAVDGRIDLIQTGLPAPAADSTIARTLPSISATSHNDLLQ